MPPVPILALLAFVGLFLYPLIGTVLGVIALRCSGYKRTTLYSGSKLYWITKGGTSADCEPLIVACAVLWPALLVVGATCALIGGCILAVGYGPAWLGVHAYEYLSLASGKGANQ